MAKDSLLELLCTQAEKWMNVNQPIEIVGTPRQGNNGVAKIDFFPRQISYCCLKDQEIEIVSDKGGLITKRDSCTIDNNFLRVETRVGDLSNGEGKGVGYSACIDDAPVDKLEAFARKIEEVTENTLKTALQNYWKYHAQYAEFEDDKFKKLSEEQSLEYHGKPKNVKVNISELADNIEEISEYIHNIKGVKDSGVTASIQKRDRKFVSFERTLNQGLSKRILSDYEKSAYISFFASIKDKEGRLVEYRQRIADLNVNRAIKKERMWATAKKLEAILNSRANCEVQQSGVYPAIFDGSVLGVLFHEGAVAHLLSSKCIDEEHATTFKGKIGERITPSFISVYNDPTMKGKWGSYEYDEEGVKSRRLPIIENGILKNYLHDRTTAGRRNIQSNGCSRSSNEKEELGYYDIDQNNLMTEPRISILEVKTSKHYNLEGMIKRMRQICKDKGLEYGLLFEGGASGSVWTGSGEFTINPECVSRIYTNGKRVPVSSVYLLGSPYVMLNQIEMMGGPITKDYGFCGSDSGFVHTQEISPYGLLANVEVRKVGEDKPRDLIKEK